MRRDPRAQHLRRARLRRDSMTVARRPVLSFAAVFVFVHVSTAASAQSPGQEESAAGQWWVSVRRESLAGQRQDMIGTSEVSQAAARDTAPPALYHRGFEQVWQRALEHAAFIYAAIGVTLDWGSGYTAADDEGEAAIYIAVEVLSGARIDDFMRHTDMPSTVLAVAPHQTRRIYLFWDRIARRAQRDEVPYEVVLGRVLAHEIGHHLLPAKGHSSYGLMSGVLNYKSPEPPTFNDAEVASIRTLLSELLP